MSTPPFTDSYRAAVNAAARTDRKFKRDATDMAGQLQRTVERVRELLAADDADGARAEMVRLMTEASTLAVDVATLAGRRYGQAELQGVAQ